MFLILRFSRFLRCCGWVQTFPINLVPPSGLRYEDSHDLTDATAAFTIFTLTPFVAFVGESVCPQVLDAVTS